MYYLILLESIEYFLHNHNNEGLRITILLNRGDF